MRINFNDFWRLPAGIDTEKERPEPPSPTQFWWATGPDGEVVGRVRARFSDEELALLFQ